jgi:3-oxoacyl-[acyl-carrier-protein] synthase II
MVHYPHPDGLGAKRNAMLRCGLKPTDVDGVTCTYFNSSRRFAESKAITHVFGEHAYKMI